MTFDEWWKQNEPMYPEPWEKKQVARAWQVALLEAADIAGTHGPRQATTDTDYEQGTMIAAAEIACKIRTKAEEVGREK